MRSKFRNILCLGVMATLLSTSIYAAPVSTENLSVVEHTESGVIVYEDVDAIESRLNFSDNIYITTNGYTNLTSDDNVFKAKLKITNHSNNAGPILIKIVNGDGEDIYVSNEGLAAGKSHTITIPSNIGRYTIKIKAVTGEGNYLIKAED